jgi:S-adenosyl methyltransferase
VADEQPMPRGLDVTKPNIARVYDAFLGVAQDGLWLAEVRGGKQRAGAIYLAISSFKMPGPEHPEDAAKTAEMEKLFNEKLGTGRWRDNDEILSWFGDWEMVGPGLVPLPEWRPVVRGSQRRNATYYGFVGGLARKP